MKIPSNIEEIRLSKLTLQDRHEIKVYCINANIEMYSMYSIIS
ncbi:MAG: hypothetical protein RR623_06825 [Bacilli bacterium]